MSIERIFSHTVQESNITGQAAVVVLLRGTEGAFATLSEGVEFVFVFKSVNKVQ